MDGEFLSGLDADEILAVRENMEAAVRLKGGPDARRIPERLCGEVEQLLYFLELAVRQSKEVGTS
ncbi:MAG: hypothetical protein ABJP34_04090 [Erythrobacter sp.]